MLSIMEEAPVHAGPTGRPSGFRIRESGQGLRVTRRAKGGASVLLPPAADDALAALAVFAPQGNPTLDPATQLSLVDPRTGRSLSFRASSLTAVAELVSSFAVLEAVPEIVVEPVAERLPEAIFETRPLADGAPDWIRGNPDFRPVLAEDDGRIVLRFTGVEMDPKSKYQVAGKSEAGEAPKWGYEVFADGTPFGWVVLLAPGEVLVTGIAGGKHSKHRTIRSAMFRLSSHLADRS